MSRPLRIDFPGAIHHVTSRGNGYAPVFLGDEDRRQFLRFLSECVGRFAWVCHAYCLMGNHYHLMIETPEANISAAMRHLNGCYTQWFNWRHDRVGHVLQGRFKSILVDRDAYLLELCRYIVLNPVRAQLVGDVAAYRWSSYGATSGAIVAPDWLHRAWLLAQFDDDLTVASGKYVEFVAQGVARPSPMCAVKGQVLLGTDDFVSAMRPRMEQKGEAEGVPAEQRFAYRPELATFLAQANGGKAERDALIRRAHRDFHYTKADIARATGMHRSTIGNIILFRE